MKQKTTGPVGAYTTENKKGHTGWAKGMLKASVCVAAVLAALGVSAQPSAVPSGSVPVQPVWSKNDGTLNAQNLISVAPKDLNVQQTQLLCNALVKDQVFHWTKTANILDTYVMIKNAGTGFKGRYYDEQQMKDIQEVVGSVLSKANMDEEAKIKQFNQSLKEHASGAMHLWLLMDYAARKRPFADIDGRWYFTLPSGSDIDMALSDGLVAKAKRKNGYDYVVQVSNACIGMWKNLESELSKSPQVSGWQKQVIDGTSGSYAKQVRDALLSEYEGRYLNGVKLQGDRFKDDVFHNILWTLEPKVLDGLIKDQSNKAPVGPASKEQKQSNK